jgi:hypothetical protein
MEFGNVPSEYITPELRTYLTGMQQQQPPATAPLALNPLNANGAIPSSYLGGTTTSDVLSTRNYLEGLQKSLMAAATPTASELSANQQLRDVDQQALEARSQNEAEINRLMTTANLTREQAGGFLTETNRRAQNNATQLALQRSAYSNVAANEQSQRQAQTDAYKLLYQMQQPQSVGGSLVNPTTGEVVYKAPSSVADQYGTGSIGEYNFYAAQEQKAGRSPLSYQEYQTADANRKSLATGLSASQINSTVNSIAGAFDDEPIVKNFNVIAEGATFASSIANKANPTSADDQGLVYAFAKAMDPNSAVKEGEYITVQKYNQSLIQQGWANAKRIAQNVAFLTPEARQNMLATINSKYAAAQQAYGNVKSQYQRQIDDAYVGKQRTITDYQAGYGQPQQIQGGAIVQTREGPINTNW